MDFLGDKLSGAQVHMSHWVGSVRRSLQEALNLVTTAVAPERAEGEGPSRAPFKRTASLRHLAARSRESFRQLSVRGQRRLSSLKKRPASLDHQQEAPDSEQLKQCRGRSPAGAAGDSEVLLQEAESLAPETSSSESSPAHTQLQPPSSSSSPAGRVSADDQQGSTKEQRSASPDGSSPGGDSAEGTKASLPVGGTLDFAFLEQTPVLDSGALKSRVLLSKRRRQPRAPSSHLLRKSPAGGADPLLEEAASPWMFKDSTDPKSTEGEDLGRDERSVPAERLSSSQTPRRPVFPGVDPSAIKAQLRKRRESEGGEEVLPEPLSKSPKGLPQAGAGGRGLGTAPEKGGRSPEPPSPQWLQELKSKKKQSQAERPV